MKTKYVIEKGEETGIKPTRDGLFIADITDMETLEEWEARLEYLKQPYITAYRKIGVKVFYSIFTNVRGKNSKFKTMVDNE